MSDICFKRVSLITWSVLILLTLTSFYLAEVDEPSFFTSLLIVFMSSCKFLGVSFSYMEVFQAHFFWKASMIFIVMIYFVCVCSLL